MKVAIIGTVGVPANYGGYETLAENLISRKCNTSIEYQVYCSSKAYKIKLKKYKGATLKYYPLNANGWQALVYDSISLVHAYLTADFILSLGTSSCTILPLIKHFSKKIVIVNFDGLDHKREKWSSLSKIIISATRKLAARYADVCISDNEEIKKYVKKVYKRDSVLIEYGGDNAKPVCDEEMLAKYGLAVREYVFKVARVEPENNIAMILESFTRIPSQKLVIVGNWNKSTYGKILRRKYILYPNIIMLDPIYDSKILDILRSNCKIYIHGHSAGGTNPSLVEAMNLRLPIFAYGVSYNKATTEKKALYFYNTDSLIKLLNSINEAELNTVADEMYKIAKRRYQWDVICERYEALFKYQNA